MKHEATHQNPESPEMKRVSRIFAVLTIAAMLSTAQVRPVGAPTCGPYGSGYGMADGSCYEPAPPPDLPPCWLAFAVIAIWVH